MKKEMIKMLALLFLGAAALSSCSVENQGRHRRHYRDGHVNNYWDRDHLHDRHYHNNY